MRLVLYGLLALLAGCGSSSLPSSGEAYSAVAETVSAREDLATAAAGPLTVNLSPGWNPVGLQCASVSSLSATGVAGMAYYTGPAFQTANFGLAEVNAGEGPRRGLFVFATGAGTLSYSGTDAAVTLNLLAGWNLVSFCTTNSLGADDLTCRRNGTAVAPGSVLLTQFQELQPDQSVRAVDITAGGRLTPGRAIWIYALEAVTLQVTGSGQPAASPTPAPSASPLTGGDISRLASKFSGAVQVNVGANEITLSSQSQPDHISAYWPTTNPLYQAYNNPAFRPNPGSIQPVGLTVRVPRFPREANPKVATPMGPIGISRNGVPFYNQYAANFQPLTMELAGMDQGNGHPSPFNQYHYHLEPFLITGAHGKNSFVGLLTDGFPVYGPVEGDRTLTNADLDAYHGHFGTTPDFPEGIYHYHITSTDPYINGGSFYGVPGTATR